MIQKISCFSLVAILVISSFAVSAFSQSNDGQVNLMLSTQPAGQDPQRYKGFVEPKYKEFESRALYLAMRDGVKIAIDVVLPKGLPAGEKLPTIMNMTRCWRSRQGGQPGTWFPQFGYARVLVDARGTGSSYGVWRAPFSADEIKDYDEVVNWIVAQPWSNGKVGSFGNSYEGNTALWLATTMNPAVKAVMPRHFEFDLFSETPYPGGLLTDWMVKTWNEGNRQLDSNPGARLVDEDTDQRLFREATKQRAGNLNVYAAALKTVARDDQEFGPSLDMISLHTHLPQIEKSRVAINSWGGWFDAATADAEIRSFMSLANYHRAIIGPWNHGASQNASPYQTANSPRLMQSYEWLRFFDQYLKGVDTGLDAEKSCYYFTIGEEQWKVTNTWPVAGTKMVRWYLDETNLLSTAAPKSAAGEDRYTVNFEATTGAKNRWHTQVGGQVVYPDRAEEDKKLLTYTTPPFDADTEITGYPIANLLITSTATDAAFSIYLEDINEAGNVTYITEGVLRAIHRKISNEKPPYKILTPYHSFKRKDLMPLVSGQVAELRFGLQPTSVLIRKGHRLRIAIAGHDKETFARIPAEGVPTITMARNKRNASWIELPVIEKHGVKGKG